MATNQNIPIVTQPFMYINDMNIAWASNTTLTVAAGQCRDSSNTIDINLGNYLGANPDISANTTTTLNAAVNGVNGLDTGSLANSTKYYVYAIADSFGFNRPGVILSTSATSPIMPSGSFPSGYNVFRKIGFALTDGSAHFLHYYITGNGNSRLYTLDAVQTAKTSGGSATYAALDLSGGLPSTVQEINLLYTFVPNTQGNSFNFRPTGSSSTSNTGASNKVTGNPGLLGELAVLTNTAQSIDWKTGEGTDALTLWYYQFRMYL